jgi:tungstate transport system permease protein
MGYLWGELRSAIPLIVHGNSYIVDVTLTTIRVALISTGCAIVIGMPIGVALGLGRFRGRRALQILANASLALPPVLVGVFVLLMLLPQGTQTILALPYIVALTPAAIQGLAPGLLAQARALDAGRLQLSVFALREARIGVMAAVIAALGSALSEVGAVIIVGGNIENHTQTLASAIVAQVSDAANFSYALGIGIVLLGLILLLAGFLTFLQQRTSGINLRFSAAA